MSIPIRFAGFLLLWLLPLNGCDRSQGSGASNKSADSAGVAQADSTVGGRKLTGGRKQKKNGKKKDGDKKADEAVTVDVAVLGTGPIEAVIRGSASLEAENRVEVVAEASRRVRDLLVEEGDPVRKGQALLRLQDDEQRSALARAETQLARAQREFDRQEKLFRQNLTMEKALNDAAYDLDQQRIAREDARRELSYTEVKAPISGTVTSRMVNVGDQVQIGQKLFEIVDFNSLVARIYVPEKNLKDLRKGQEARVTGRAVSETPFPGRVERIAPVVDPRSGTVKVTVAVGGQAGLRPGLYVDVDLVTAVHDRALLVPKRALVYDHDQVFVYRLGKGRQVERLLIVPVLADVDFIEPLQGLAAGDSVVVAGQAGLKHGARVALVSDRKPTPAAGGEKAEATP